MPPEIENPSEACSRRWRPIDLAPLLLGAGVGVWLVRSALAATPLDWRLDWDVGVMVGLLLCPAGVVWVVGPWLFIRRSAKWSLETGLWLALGLCGLAWTEVLLDAGVYLGAAAKFAGGTTAFFLSPAVALGAALVGLLSFVQQPRQYDWSRCLAIALGLTAGAGWIAFLAVMLPLKTLGAAP